MYMKRAKMNLLLIMGMLLIFISVSIGCKKDDSITEEIPPIDTTEQTLKEKAAFNIGAAVKSTYLDDADYSGTLKEHFSQITAEFEMKMQKIWLAPASYNWVEADKIVDFAMQNEMQVHGHTLVWYNSFPVWFKVAQYDSTNFENNVKDYITAVVSRYKDKVISWDVANEIFDDFGKLRVDETVYATFDDPIAFYGRCFQYARDADSDAKLFYNDYDLSLSGSKRYGVTQMLTRFNSEGYPIDGLGDQFHYTVTTNQGTIKNGLNGLAATGLLIHISELDIRVNVSKSDSYVFTTAEKQKQADVYKAIVEMYELIPQNQKFGISLWGVTDKYTWLSGYWHLLEYPLLFDKEYNKKDAYDGFLDGLN
jgi:endo-1,4-beta-xylanase